MASRLIELVIPKEQEPRVSSLVDELGVARLMRLEDNGRVLLRLLLDSESTEVFVERLGGRLALAEGYRIVVTPVLAVLPPIDPGVEKITGDGEATETPQPVGRTVGRIGRDELLSDIRDASRVTRNFIIFTALATVVAAVGMAKSSAAIVIGAMVIAPLLGPSIALSLATALGDRRLAADAVRSNLVGFSLALALSVVIGLTGQVDLSAPEIVSRTSAGWGDLTLAVAAGAAGAMAFSSGLGTSLVGVMVAVALLPPTVVVGLLIGAAAWDRLVGASLLLAINLVSINFSGVVVFLCQGLRPPHMRSSGGAKRLPGIIVMWIWAMMLAALAGLIYLSSRRG